MIEHTQEIKIHLQHVATTQQTSKQPPPHSIKRRSLVRARNQKDTSIGTFDFTVIPSRHESPSQPSQPDSRRNRKISSYMAYKQKQKETYRQNRSRNSLLSRSLARRYRQHSPELSVTKNHVRGSSLRVKPSQKEKNLVSMVFMGSETMEPYRPSDNSRRILMKTSQGKRQTIDTGSYIEKLKIKHMNKTMEVRRTEPIHLRPPKQNSSVEISRVKQGWLHRRSKTAAVNMVHWGKSNKKKQKFKREETVIRNSGGQMCRPWTPRHARDEILNAEEF